MKKIAVFLYFMECGGVEAAVADLLRCISPEEYTVELYLLEIRGDFLKRLPPYVQVKPMPISPVERELVDAMDIRKTIKTGLSAGKLWETLRLAARYTFFRLTKEPMPAYRAALGKKKRITCDIALDFHGYLSLTTYLTAWNVEAEKRYCWIHSQSFADRIAAHHKHLDRFDRIFCVSELCRQRTQQALPGMEARISVMHNLIDLERVLRLAQSGAVLEEKGKTKLLTVGRLSYAKGYDFAVQAAAQLREAGMEFHWYFCGEGEDRPMLEEQIRQLGLQDRITLLGFQENPYSLMKSCDIYVQPSRYEGYAITVVEASALGCAVISTDVSGAREEIVEGVNGFVTEISPDAVAQGILRLAGDPELLKKMANRKPDNSHINRKSLDLLDQILEGRA